MPLLASPAVLFDPDKTFGSDHMWAITIPMKESLRPSHFDEPPRIKCAPDLVRKEGLALVLSLAVVCLLGALVDAPLELPADPGGLPSSNVKAPWVFVGIQYLLRFLPSFVAGVVLPITALLVIACLPFLPICGKARRILFFSLLAAAVILTVWGYVA